MPLPGRVRLRPRRAVLFPYLSAITTCLPRCAVPLTVYFHSAPLVFCLSGVRWMRSKAVRRRRAWKQCLSPPPLFNLKLLMAHTHTPSAYSRRSVPCDDAKVARRITFNGSINFNLLSAECVPSHRRHMRFSFQCDAHNLHWFHSFVLLANDIHAKVMYIKLKL